MIRLTPAGLRTLATRLSLVLFAGCADTNQATLPILDDLPMAASYWTPGNGVEPFKVYTQNTYLGGDTGPLFSLDFDFGDPVKVGLILAAVNGFWADVQNSDIPGRASAIVDEIDAKQPHLVGLQEVVQFGILDGNLQPTGQGADMLAVIVHMLGIRGLPYEVVAIQSNTSSALPMAVDPTTFAVTQYLGFTDRIAVLRRTDVVVTPSGVSQGSYRAAFDLIPSRPGALTLRRGWIRATTMHNGTPHHFVVTHLETQGLAPVQAGQADELINQVMRGLDGVTILAGDLNSDAEAGPGDRSWTPTYDALIADGFTDAWLKYTGGDEGPGYTCCQDPSLENYPSVLDERIDFVLVRDSRGSSRIVRGGMRVEIVGEEGGDLTPVSGLWPADHAGLVAGLRIPKGK